MDTAQWPQGIGVENGRVGVTGAAMLERRAAARPQKEQALNCPRCNSGNTKFCYYNNYSLSQPRYFCKTCRRYWTEGGSLRNVPVGGGSRKNKRGTPPAAGSSIRKTGADPVPNPFSSDHHHNPSGIHAGHDLNLAYPPFTADRYNAAPRHDFAAARTPGATSSGAHHIPAMELLKTSAAGYGSTGVGSFQDPVAAIYASGYGNLQGYRPGAAAASAAMSFSGDGFDQSGGYAGLEGVHVQDNSGGGGGGGACRLLFPFEDLKQQVSSTAHEVDQQGRGSQGTCATPGYWNGMLGGGSW